MHTGRETPPGGRRRKRIWTCSTIGSVPDNGKVVAMQSLNERATPLFGRPASEFLRGAVLNRRFQQDIAGSSHLKICCVFPWKRLDTCIYREKRGESPVFQHGTFDIR